MNCFGCKREINKVEKGLVGEVKLLQEEIIAIMREREKEGRAYERDVMVFAFKEEEWKQERKKLREEVKSLRKMVEEKEEKIRGMEGGLVVGEKSEKDWQIIGTTTTTTTTSFLVEQMREERAWRDEAVDKWKKLYLAIKNELDDLIHRTHRGEGLYWRAEEEEMIEELKMELMIKEKAIEDLKVRLAAVEQERYRTARQLDMLRQSLRIINNKKAASSRCAPRKPILILGKQAEKAWQQ